MTSVHSTTLHADPNVTPLIDVLLVLLIIFMVIVPVTPRGLSAMIPQPPKSAQPAPQTIVVQILAGPAGPLCKINGQRVEGNSRLAAELTRIYATRAEKVLFIQGDPGVDFASVAAILDLSHAIGIDHVGLLTPAMSSR